MKFPSIPLPGRDNWSTVAMRLKLIVDQLTGAGGDTANRAVMLDDFANGGAIQQMAQDGTIIGYDPTKDLSTPPAPTNVSVAAGYGTYTVEWDDPGGLVYRNPSYAEVWGGPTNVLGNAIKLGTSTSNFFVDRGNLGETKYFWVRFISAANIVGPYNATDGTSGTLGKIGNADLSDLAVTAAKLADGAVDLSTNKVTNATNFGAIAVGYTVTQYLLTTSGVMQNLIVDDAHIANLSAAKITVGDGTIGGQLKSANYSAGTAGWILRPDGFAQLPAAAIIGALTAGSVTTPYLSALSADLGDIHAGMINFGDFTGFAWPASGHTGVHLSSNGLLMGNFNDGQWVEIDQNGQMSMPGFSTSGGNATFSGNLSAASGTFGTVTAGVLRNAGNTIRVDLNASGGSYFIQAPGVGITADGDAFFTKSIASNTWTGSFDALTGGTFLIDTGVNKPNTAFYDRSLTCRLGAATISYSPGESAGNYVCALDFETRIITRKPFFAGGGESPGQNPYGANSERVFIEVLCSVGDADGKTTITLTSLQWTLDTAG